MTVEVNGIAHIELTVNDPERCIPFWEKLCHFLQIKTLIKGEGGRLGPGGAGPRSVYASRSSVHSQT